MNLHKVGIWTDVDGCPIYSRSFGLTCYIAHDAAFDERALLDDGWRRHPPVPNVFNHPDFEDDFISLHHGAWLVGQRFRTVPDLGRAADIARNALGGRVLSHTITPLALLIPLRAEGRKLNSPNDACRCRKVWPVGDFDVRDILGTQTEFRVVAHRLDEAPDLTFSLELSVGRARATALGEPRSKFYLADHRIHLAHPGDDYALRYTLNVVDAGLRFVETLEHLGLRLDATGKRRTDIVQLGTIETLSRARDFALDMRWPSTVSTHRSRVVATFSPPYWASVGPHGAPTSSRRVRHLLSQLDEFMSSPIRSFDSATGWSEGAGTLPTERNKTPGRRVASLASGRAQARASTAR